MEDRTDYLFNAAIKSRITVMGRGGFRV